MTKALKKIDPDVHFRVLYLLEREPSFTQRELAERLGRRQLLSQGTHRYRSYQGW
jgi:hypothetical protein